MDAHTVRREGTQASLAGGTAHGTPTSTCIVNAGARIALSSWPQYNFGPRIEIELGREEHAQLTPHAQCCDQLTALLSWAGPPNVHLAHQCQQGSCDLRGVWVTCFSLWRLCSAHASTQRLGTTTPSQASLTSTSSSRSSAVNSTFCSRMAPLERATHNLLRASANQGENTAHVG